MWTFIFLALVHPPIGLFPLILDINQLWVSSTTPREKLFLWLCFILWVSQNPHYPILKFDKKIFLTHLTTPPQKLNVSNISGVIDPILRNIKHRFLGISRTDSDKKELLNTNCLIKQIFDQHSFLEEATHSYSSFFLLATS